MYPRGALWLCLPPLALLALYPLLGAELQLGHDAQSYVPRLVEFREALRAGHLPPIWAANLSQGHGQPFFQFAPPLLYALALPFLELGLGAARALQLPLFLATLGGALALGALLRDVADEGAGVVAGAALLYAPYLQVDLYVRAAYAEALALALLPVLLLAIRQASRAATLARLSALGAATLALGLAHPPGFLMALGAAAVFAPASALAERRARALAGPGLGLLLGLAWSAFWWLPAHAEKDLVKTGLLTSQIPYSDHFVHWPQLLWSRWGFGHSVPGPGDGMPFYLGPVQLLLGAWGAWRALRSPKPSQRTLGLAALLTLGVATWLTLPASSGVWAALPWLRFFAYPWRLLALGSVALALLAGLALAGLRARHAGLAVLLLVALNQRHVGAWGSRPLEPHEVDPAAIARKPTRSTLFEEYEPRTARAGLPYQPQPLEAALVGFRVRVLEQSPARQRYEVEASAPTAVVARTFAYPGWTVRVDDREVPSHAEEHSGRLAFEVAAGTRRVELALEPTAVRRRGLWLSTSAVSAWLGVLLLWPRRPRVEARSAETGRRGGAA